MCVCERVLSCFSRVRLFATLWTVTLQAPLSMDSPGKNTGVGCHGLLQGYLPDPGIEPVSLMSPALMGGFFTSSATWEVHSLTCACKKITCINKICLKINL